MNKDINAAMLLLSYLIEDIESSLCYESWKIIKEYINELETFKQETLLAMERNIDDGK